MLPLSKIGERGLIRRIERALGTPRIPSPHRILTGPGDDACVVKFSTHAPLAFTTDTLVEGVHFRPDWMRRFMAENEAWKAIGYKAMAVNLSDLAAMGRSRPLLALFTLGARGDISVDTVENLSRGISKLTRNFGFSVLGGDTIRSDKTIVSITLVGEILTNNPVLRSGADFGDILMCSGPLGLSMAGLEILKMGSRSLTSGERLLLRRHLYPSPRLKEGSFLGNVDKISTSMLDTSDDLRTSLEILARESGVGLECDLSRAPIHPALSRFCKGRRSSPYSYVLYGGEDYELLFTVKPARVGSVLKKIPGSFVLGRAVRSKGVSILKNGLRYDLKDARFKHF